MRAYLTLMSSLFLTVLAVPMIIAQTPTPTPPIRRTVPVLSAPTPTPAPSASPAIRRPPAIVITKADPTASQPPTVPKPHPFTVIPKNLLPAYVISGTLKLTPVQVTVWDKMLSSSKLTQLATGLWPVKSDYKEDTNAPGGFPVDPTDYFHYRSVYSSPTNVRLMARVDGTGGVALDYVLQISNQSKTYNLVAPYIGWEKPAGLVSQEVFKKPPASLNPEDPLHSNYNTIHLAGPGSPTIKLGPSTNYVYFNKKFPFFTSLGKAGTYFYVRVVPVLANKTPLTPAAPPSNWVVFYIDISKSEQEDKIDTEIAAIAKEKATKLAAVAKAQEDEKINNIKAEADTFRKALSDAYEIRLLSYIPPKFYDDPNALNYFIAKTNVNIQSDETAGNLTYGMTYDVNAIKNMLNSNKTWQQETWDLASASLNQVSQGYQAAKNACVDTVASGINLAGLKCGNSCKDNLMTGLNATLAACGVPPSVPNIDQLYHNGLDYLSKTIADAALEQATGFAIGTLGAEAENTKELAEHARGPMADGISKMLDTIAHPAPFDTAVPETWGVPSPYFRHRPAMLYLEIRLKSEATPPANLTWQSFGVFFNDEFHNIPQIALPRTIGTPLRIPIALSPIDDPSSWLKSELFDDLNNRVGQPHYGGRPGVTITPFSHHNTKDGSSVAMVWPQIQINSGFVTAIPLPTFVGLDNPIQIHKTSKLEDALKNGQVVDGPPNYYGKIRLIWF